MPKHESLDMQTMVMQVLDFARGKLGRIWRTKDLAGNEVQLQNFRVHRRDICNEVGEREVYQIEGFEVLEITC